MFKLHEEYEVQIFFPLAKTLHLFNTTQKSYDLATLIYQFISHISACLFADYYHQLSLYKNCKEVEDFIFQPQRADLDFQIRLITLLVATHPIHEPYIHPNLKLLEMTFWEEVEQLRQFYRTAIRYNYLISAQELKKCQKLFKITLERFYSFISTPIILLESASCTRLNGKHPQSITSPPLKEEGIYLQKGEDKWVPLMPSYDSKPAPEFNSFQFFQQSVWQDQPRFKSSFERYQRELQGHIDFSVLEKQHPHYFLAYRLQVPLKTFFKKSEERLLCLGAPGLGKTAMSIHLEKICSLKNYLILKYFVQYQTLFQSSFLFIRYFHYTLSQHIALSWTPPKEDAKLMDFFLETLKLLAKQNKTFLLILDNLDEAMEPFFPGEESLFNLICREFPTNFKIIVTARSNFFGHSYLADRLLELVPLNAQENQRFLKDLGHKQSKEAEKKFQIAEGNPMILSEMFAWDQADLALLPSLESYFRKLFIRYSTALNLKIFLTLLQYPQGISLAELTQQIRWLSPTISRQIHGIKPLLQGFPNKIRFFHPLFYGYLRQLLQHLPFSKKVD